MRRSVKASDDAALPMVVNHHQRCRLSLGSFRAFLGRARRHLRVKADYSVCLTGDAEVRELNRLYRGVNRATDVLSFPFEAESALAEQDYLGDIVISLDTALRQAQSLRHPLEQEVRILAMHGLLHLLGYDHETDGGQMLAMEESLRKLLRLPAGLIVRSSAHAVKKPRQRSVVSARAQGTKKRERVTPPARAHLLVESSRSVSVRSG
jgi:probable rRNA maturation factor